MVFIFSAKTRLFEKSLSKNFLQFIIENVYLAKADGILPSAFGLN